MSTRLVSITAFLAACGSSGGPAADDTTEPPDATPPPPPPDAAPCAYRTPHLGAPEIVVDRDLTYAVVTDAFGVHDLALDIARPREAGLRPAIVWMHGGQFQAGNRSNMDEYVMESASRGYVAATISYRLRGADDPDALYQEKLAVAHADARAAVRWMRANAATYGIDPDRIAFGGFSAGGLTALQVGYEYDTFTADDNPANPGFSERAQAIVTLDSMNPDATMLPGDPPFAVFRATVTGTGGEDEGVADAAEAAMTELAIAAGIAYRFTPVEGAMHNDLDEPAFSPFIAAGAADFLCDHGMAD